MGYTESDIVGGARTTKNGVLAGYVNVPGKSKPQFRFIKISKKPENHIQMGGLSEKKKKRKINKKESQSPVSLRTAVKLLRQYYHEKYGKN